jgi:hypothetical protein
VCNVRCWNIWWRNKNKKTPGRPKCFPCPSGGGRRKAAALGPLSSGQIVGTPSSEGVTGDVPPLPWCGLVSSLIRNQISFFKPLF